MADTRQVAEEVAAALKLPVADVARVLRAEHSVIQRRVAAGERVVLTGFLSMEPTNTGGARFAAGTRFRRVLHGTAEPPTIQPAPAPRRPAAAKKATPAPTKKAASKQATSKKSAAKKKTKAGPTKKAASSKAAPTKKAASTKAAPTKKSGRKR